MGWRLRTLADTRSFVRSFSGELHSPACFDWCYHLHRTQKPHTHTHLDSVTAHLYWNKYAIVWGAHNREPHTHNSPAVWHRLHRHVFATMFGLLAGLKEVFSACVMCCHFLLCRTKGAAVWNTSKYGRRADRCSTWGSAMRQVTCTPLHHSRMMRHFSSQPALTNRLSSVISFGTSYHPSTGIIMNNLARRRRRDRDAKHECIIELFKPVYAAVQFVGAAEARDSQRQTMFVRAQLWSLHEQRRAQQTPTDNLGELFSLSFWAVRACVPILIWLIFAMKSSTCVCVRSHTRDQWCNIHSHDGWNVRARSNDRKSTRARAIFTQYQCSVAGAVRTLWNSHTVECVMKWLKTGHVCSNIPSSSDARGSLVCGMSEFNNVRPESGHVPTKNFTAVVVAFSGPASHSVDIFQNRFPISCTVRASHVDKREVCYVFFLVAVVGINLAFGHIRMRRTLD